MFEQSNIISRPMVHRALHVLSFLIGVATLFITGAAWVRGG